MKPKTMILMVVAVVCGLGASYMTSRLLAERDDHAEPEIPKVTLLVAKKNLDMHVPLRTKPEDYFVEKQFVKDDAPKDGFTKDDMAKLKNKWMKRALRKGDAVTPEDLMDNPRGLATLAPGMRAVGIRVRVEDIAGGFASLPGSHVDIIWTVREGGTGQTVAKLLLEDVIVLAADTSDRPGEQTAMVASVVTVALSPEDALKVAQAMDTGALRLTLRNIEDKGSTSVQPKRDEALRDEEPKVALRTPELPGRPEMPEHVEPAPAKQEAQPAHKPKVAKLPEGIRKFTVRVVNASETKVYHYWLDSNDNVVPEPEMDAQNSPAAPNGSFAPSGKFDAKKF